MADEDISALSDARVSELIRDFVAPKGVTLSPESDTRFYSVNVSGVNVIHRAVFLFLQANNLRCSPNLEEAIRLHEPQAVSLKDMCAAFDALTTEGSTATKVQIFVAARFLTRRIQRVLDALE